LPIFLDRHCFTHPGQFISMTGVGDLREALPQLAK